MFQCDSVNHAIIYGWVRILHYIIIPSPKKYYIKNQIQLLDFWNILYFFASYTYTFNHKSLTSLEVLHFFSFLFIYFVAFTNPSSSHNFLLRKLEYLLVTFCYMVWLHELKRKSAPHLTYSIYHLIFKRLT